MEDKKTERKKEIAMRFVKTYLEEDIPDEEKNLKNPLQRYWMASDLFYSYRGLACSRYILEGSVEDFRKTMDTAIDYGFFELECDPVTYPCAESTFVVRLFDALACGAFPKVKRFLLDNAPNVYEEKERKHLRDVLYLFLEGVLTDLREEKKVLKDIENLIEYHKKRDPICFPIALACKGVFTKDAKLFQRALEDVLDNYRDLEEENEHLILNYFIASFFLGFANLALAVGLDVDIDHEFLPKELLLTPREAQDLFLQAPSPEKKREKREKPSEEHLKIRQENAKKGLALIDEELEEESEPEEWPSCEAGRHQRLHKIYHAQACTCYFTAKEKDQFYKSIKNMIESFSRYLALEGCLNINDNHLPVLKNAALCGDFLGLNELMNRLDLVRGFDLNCLCPESLEDFFFQLILKRPAPIDTKRLIKEIEAFLERYHHKPHDKLMHLKLCHAILKKDESLFQKALDEVMLYKEPNNELFDHENLSYFIWHEELGYASIARLFGLKFSLDHPYLPEDLLLPQTILEENYKKHILKQA